MPVASLLQVCCPALGWPRPVRMENTKCNWLSGSFVFLIDIPGQTSDTGLVNT